MEKFMRNALMNVDFETDLMSIKPSLQPIAIPVCHPCPCYWWMGGVEIEKKIVLSLKQY